MSLEHCVFLLNLNVCASEESLSWMDFWLNVWQELKVQNKVLPQDKSEINECFSQSIVKKENIF